MVVVLSPFRSSILTFVPGLPVYLHVIVPLVPAIQFSFPTGDVKVIFGPAIVKSPLLVAEHELFVMLVTLMR